MANFISLFSFVVYRYLLIPISVFLLESLRLFLPQKIQLMISDRQELRWPELPSRPIWIHASSGEIEYAKPLIRALKQKWPQRMILVTYFSPSAKKLLKSVEGIDALIPMPWDHRKLVGQFLRHFQPEFLLIARTDVWPEFAYQCYQQKIPSILFAATFSTQSRRKGFFSTPLTRFAFNQLSAIDCVSEEDAIEIKKMSVSTITEIMGDTRFDQVIWRVQNPLPVKNLSAKNSRPCWVIGSSWAQDEAVLIPSFSKFMNAGGSIIIAPHELSRKNIESLQAKFQKLGLKYCLFSEVSDWNSEEILIIDEIGHLQEIYSWGDLAFVGGSFKEKVHSVMEPLAAGLPTLVGPLHSNNREALHFQNVFLSQPSTALVSVICDSEDLAKQLQMLISQHKNWNNLKQEIRSKILQKSGATAKLLGQIEAYSQ